MPNQTIPIQLPDAIYQRLQQVAQATNHSIEEVVLQTIRGNLPPSLDDLSPEWRCVVADLQHMSDEALWAVAATNVCCRRAKRGLFQRLSTKSWQNCVLQPIALSPVALMPWHF
jgi:hypothetical protein